MRHALKLHNLELSNRIQQLNSKRARPIQNTGNREPPQSDSERETGADPSDNGIQGGNVEQFASLMTAGERCERKNCPIL